MDTNNQNADQGWDSYQERVLRNEGRLEGLEQLVRETRAADAKLVSQRSDSLAKELTDTAESLRHLMAEQRAADKEEFRAELGAAKELAEAFRTEFEKRVERNVEMTREANETAVAKNYEQSQGAIRALEDRTHAEYQSTEQIVTAWRESDREARLLQATEYERRLEALNHNHERTADVLAGSVNREVFAQAMQTITDKVGAIERAILTMPTNASIEITSNVLNARLEAMSKTLGDTSAARIEVLDEKVTELKETQTRTEGRGAGYTALYGWAIAAITVIIGVIVAANSIFGS